MTTRENDITESFTGDRMSILNEIAARTKERIAEEKFKFPLRNLSHSRIPIWRNMPRKKSLFWRH